MTEQLMFPRTYEMLKLITITGKDNGALADYRSAATLSCMHKVTKRPICAIPCNGILELCENDSDEQCQGPSLVNVLAVTVALVTIFLVSSLIWSAFSKREPKLAAIELNTLDILQEEDFDILVIKLSSFISSYDTKRALTFANDFYNKTTIGLSHQKKDEFIMKCLGTNELCSFFYDLVDYSIFIQVRCFLQKYVPRLPELLQKSCITFIWEFTDCLISMSLRYFDLPKDILVSYIIWLQLSNYDATSFPMGTFWILVSSIVTSEIVHAISIMTHESRYKGRKALLLFWTPLMPAMYMYQNLKWKIQLHKLTLVHNTDKMHDVAEYIVNIHEHCSQLQQMGAKMLCTENVLENLTNLTILSMIFLLSHTSSRAVENVDQLFLEKSEVLGLIFAAMSCTSLIRGQITFLKAHKNGCLNLFGTLSVAVYFLIGTFSRFVPF